MERKSIEIDIKDKTETEIDDLIVKTYNDAHKKEPTLENVTYEDLGQIPNIIPGKEINDDELGETASLIMEVEKLEDTYRILCGLTRKELVDLSIEAQKHYGTPNNVIVRMVMDIMAERNMFNE